MNKPIYIFLGLLIGITLSISSLLYAQIKIEPINTISKADLYYTATSTETKILNEYDMVKLKAEYNQTQEIVSELQKINSRLIRIEKLLK